MDDCALGKGFRVVIRHDADPQGLQSPGIY